MFISGAASIEVGTYCGKEKPGIIETMTNEAVVKFHSDNIEYRHYSGFSLKYSSSPESESVVSSRIVHFLRSSSNPLKRLFQSAAVN